MAENARTVCHCAPDCGERIACRETGDGHRFCGWCETHATARHNCGCPHFPPVKAGD